MDAMTKDELITALADFPGDTLLIVSKDAEGNGYSPLAEVTEGFYVPENSYAGDYYEEEDADEARKTETGSTVLCLWPTN